MSLKNSFLEQIQSYAWQDLSAQIHSISDNDVEKALSSTCELNFEHFIALISPAARKFIPQMAKLAHDLTVKRFGRTVQLFAPIYLSNECSNICTYCGFSQNNTIERLTLSQEQILAEILAVKALGFDHVLVVTGESKKVNTEYFKNALSIFKEHFAQISFEVQPLASEDYKQLVNAGMHALLVYQETYHQQRYKVHHPRGKKSNFAWRLATPERAAGAGVSKIGLGVLLGLEEWRTDLAFLALHVAYLRKHFWRTKLAVSFPRLRPAQGVLSQNSQMHVSENDLTQIILALRLYDENLELSISTRESAHFRDIAPFLGITSMSAGSRTEPGGYALNSRALEQFSTDDKRSSYQVAEALRQVGYESVWKDWQAQYGI